MYVEKMLPIRKIAEICGVTSSQVSHQAQKHGLTKEKESLRVYRDPAWLYDEHVVKGRTFRDIERQFGLAKGAVSKSARTYGIETPRLSSHVECTCATCGKKFDKLRNEYNGHLRRGQVNFYCSDECLRVARSALLQDPFVKADRISMLQAGRRRSLATDEGYRKMMASIAKARRSQARRETIIEQIVRERLEHLGINHIEQKSIGHYTVDFLLPETKICLEVNGIYWHAHPDFYPEPNDSQQRTVEKDRRKHVFLESRGYCVFYLWEHIVKSDVDLALEPVLAALAAHNDSAASTELVVQAQ